METEHDYDTAPLLHVGNIGDRSAVQMDLRVSHDLGDRTLVVVILLLLVIGTCGVVMGRNLARQDAIEQSNRKLTQEYAVHTNHTRDMEANQKAILAELKELKHEQR